MRKMKRNVGYYMDKKKIVIALGCMLSVQCISAVAAGQQKPNVVFFLVDDLGSGEVGCYASKFHETPNIDALAAQGMKFTTAYSPGTLYSPSRTALMTGRSPARLHLTDWVPGQEQNKNKK